MKPYFFSMVSRLNVPMALFALSVTTNSFPVMAADKVIEELSNLTLISQVNSIKVNNKINFADINVQGYTIPVCTDLGVPLKEHSVEDILYIGKHDIAYQGKEYLGRLSGGVQITCKVMEFRTKRSNWTDFLLLWTDFLTKFNGSYLIVEGEHGGSYGLYRLVYLDKYVQYIAVYFQPAGSLQLSVGSFPKDEEFARNTLIVMMAESELGRPGL